MTIFAFAAAYLLTLMAVRLAFRSFSKDTSDCFQGGGEAAWWIPGGSMLTLSEFGSAEIIARIMDTHPVDERFCVTNTNGDRPLRIT